MSTRHPPALWQCLLSCFGVAAESCPPGGAHRLHSHADTVKTGLEKVYKYFSFISRSNLIVLCSSHGARNIQESVLICTALTNLLVQGRDGLNGGVQGIDVHSLLCVWVKVEQGSHQVLNKTQGLTCHIPRFKLNLRRNTQPHIILSVLSKGEK